MLGVFLGELICGGLIVERNFVFQNGLGLTIKNSLTHYENSLKQLALTTSICLYLGGLVVRSIFASEIWEGGGGGLIIGILRYLCHVHKGELLYYLTLPWHVCCHMRIMLQV